MHNKYNTLKSSGSHSPPHPPVSGKVVFHKIGPGAKKTGDSCPR